MVVDRIDDAVEQAYAAWPERLYLVDLDGTVLYKGKGPMDFDPDELEADLPRRKRTLPARSITAPSLGVHFLGGRSGTPRRSGA